MPRPYKSLTADEIEAVLSRLIAGQARKVIAQQFNLSPSTVGTIYKNFAEKARSEIETEIRKWNKYKKIFRAVFEEKFAAAGAQAIDLGFTTADIAHQQAALGLTGGNPY